MFAAYQAGVYKALWPHWKPDLVVAASAGALNGRLIAGCIDPDELIERWLHPDAAAVKFRRLHQFWKAASTRVRCSIKRECICREFERKLPFGVVCTEVPRFRPRLFRDDEITPQHLVGSCSIPLLYPSVRIEGRRLVDGGLFEPTPVWAAAAMGATRVIAINAMPGVTPWAVRVAPVAHAALPQSAGAGVARRCADFALRSNGYGVGRHDLGCG